jgi:hypothetical protein
MSKFLKYLLVHQIGFTGKKSKTKTVSFLLFSLKKRKTNFIKSTVEKSELFYTFNLSVLGFRFLSSSVGGSLEETQIGG